MAAEKSAPEGEFRIEFMADPLIEALCDAIDETDAAVEVERSARGMLIFKAQAPHLIQMDRETFEEVTGMEIDMTQLTNYVVCTVGGEIRRWNADGFVVAKIGAGEK